MGRINPLPFREIKRRLEAAGFFEMSQKGSHVKFVRRAGEVVDTAVVPRKKRDSDWDLAQYPAPGTYRLG